MEGWIHERRAARSGAVHRAFHGSDRLLNATEKLNQLKLEVEVGRLAFHQLREEAKKLHLIEPSAFLADLTGYARRQRLTAMLKQVQEIETQAVALLADDARRLADATALRERLEKALERPVSPLSEPQNDQQPAGQAEDTTSLVLRETNEFIRAASEVPAMADPAGSVRVSEPQGWTFDLVPGDAGADVIKRQLLQTIAELAGTDGLDLSAMRRSLTERWYAERSASGRTKRGVDEQTWNRTWMAVKALEWDTEPVVVSGSTARRFMINPLVTGQ
jgi:hypothetical protein